MKRSPADDPAPSAAAPVSGGGAAGLLGPGDPPPFIWAGGAGRGNLLFICDHASCCVPRALNGLGLEPAQLCGHIGWDEGAAALAGFLGQRFGAPVLLAGYSRLVLDLNRTPGGEGSILGISDGIAVPANEGLSAAAIARRVRALYWPYHAALAGWLDDSSLRGNIPAVIAVHSFTPRPALSSSLPRPWQIGILWNRDPRIARPLLAHFAAHKDLCVGDNRPYTGRLFNHTLDVQAQSRGLPHVSLEIRSDLVATPEGIAQWGGVLENALRPILEEPALYQRAYF